MTAEGKHRVRDPYLGTQGTDYDSTSGIIADKTESQVKVGVGVAAVVGFILFIWSTRTAQQVNLENLLRQFWWILPVSSTVSSTLVLGTAVLAKHSRGSRKKDWLSTRAYVISSPSLAVLGFVSMFLPDATPPMWAASVVLAVLLCSAWMYYRTTEELEQESERNPGEPPFAFVGA